jgi:hypothetical protein
MFPVLIQFHFAIPIGPDARQLRGEKCTHIIRPETIARSFDECARQNHK